MGGAAYGLLFSLLGFLLGFGIFFVLWLLRGGRYGGGDLKLFAATASWLGWFFAYWLLIVSFAILAGMLTVSGFLRRHKSETETGRPAEDDSATADGKSRKRAFPYTVPLTIAAVIVCLSPAPGLWGIPLLWR